MKTTEDSAPSPMTFTIIEDGVAILRNRGVFKQTKLYQRKGYIYAAHGGGFIRLNKRDGGTSAPNVTWVDLYISLKTKTDEIGRLMVA